MILKLAEPRSRTQLSSAEDEYRGQSLKAMHVANGVHKDDITTVDNLP